MNDDHDGNDRNDSAATGASGDEERDDELPKDDENAEPVGTPSEEGNYEAGS